MRNQTIKQPVQATTLTSEDIQAIKKARKQLWQVHAIIQTMSLSQNDEPLDYSTALKGVAKLMCDTLIDFEEINL
ncbi:hypothetical protein NYR61_02340 [Actinobacillus genomosp. 1]|uniref:hypothetical protein n=1 Tax=Actinobacillus genomosp. 1 TaxID=254839 RepID=UPI0024432F13|nr:hypothetical protein [Actinobacillus genomosp. 1]WGE34415.1 hypothetical protein NYR61_02340 [Actinobacillus genomosp. 1]